MPDMHRPIDDDVVAEVEAAAIHESSSCPSCDGAHRPGDPRGLLSFDHTQECPLLAHEDATQMADFGLTAGRRRVTRDATPTERVLLLRLGFDPRDGLQTVVTPMTTTMRNRSWPTLVPTTQENA